eukprot:c10550_g1_i1.p1 GENE.c10550_g1_i1~~c10550_g1_i1.p1  ORF type:complete len:532 (+),score=94.63 c10550_g1_i1:215-1810(+)
MEASPIPATQPKALARSKVEAPIDVDQTIVTQQENSFHDPGDIMQVSSSVVKETRQQFWTESKVLLMMALPISATNMLEMIMDSVDLALVGHLGQKEMAAAAFCGTWFNSIIFAVIGVLTALDTLLSQTWGAEKKVEYGQWLVTGLFVSLLLSLPVCLVLVTIERVLLLFGIDPELAAMAGRFILPLTSSVPPLLFFICMTKYLQCQGILTPSVWIGIFANILNATLGYCIIYVFGGGFMGACTATAISRYIQLFLMIAYLLYSRPRHSLTWPEMRSWEPLRSSRLKQFFGLGVYGGATVALEIWCFEGMTFLSGTFGALAVDTHTSMYAVIAFMWMVVPLPVATATSIRVGNLLGAGDFVTCKRTARVGVALVAVVSLAASGIVYSCRHYVGWIFSSDKEVIEAVASLMYIGNLFGVFDGTQAAIAGIFRGIGRQEVVALLNLLGFWIIGVPSACIFAFKFHLQVQGLWWGLLTGLVVTSVCGCALASRVDWKKEAHDAQERVKQEDMAATHTEAHSVKQMTEHTHLIFS